MEFATISIVMLLAQAALRLLFYKCAGKPWSSRWPSRALLLCLSSPRLRGPRPL